MTPALLTKISARPNFFERFGDKFLRRILEGNVANPAVGFRLQRADLADCLIELSGRARAQREFGAFARIGDGDSFADAASTAGDERDFT